MKIWRIEDGKLKLRLHPGQAKAWRSDKRFVFMLAGTQGGKTSFGSWWLWREVQRCGEGDYLAVTASFDLFKLKMLPEMRAVFERILGIGRYWAGDKIIEIRDPKTTKFWATRASDPMYARIILRSAQSEGGLESATAKAAWLDECGQDKFKLSDWEAVLRRLSLNQGRVLGGTTLYNLGWLKSQVYDQWKAGDTDFDVIQFESTVNPAFPQAEYDRARRTLPAWKLRMFYEGQFDRPAGLIYDVFDEDVHLINPIPIPPDWPRVVGIDPIGAVTAALWLAWDERGQQLHVYREMYNPYGKTTRENAAEVLQLSRGERIVKYICGAVSERQARLDWQACGVPVDEPPFSSVESGIDRVYGLFKTNGIVIHRGCAPHLVDELSIYSRKLDANDEPTEVIKNKNDFHCLIGNTLVATDKGEIPLKDVTIEDYVLTRKGYRRVLDTARTSNSAEVYKVIFSNGKILVGTGKHPVWVNGKGYTDLHALRYGDTMLTITTEENGQKCHQRKRAMECQSRSNDMDVLGLDIQKEKPRHAGDMLPESICTNMYGKLPTDSFYQMDGISIISMAIQQIMHQKISSLYQLANISSTTGANNLRNSDRGPENILRTSENWRRHGTNHRLGVSGIRFLVRWLGSRGSLSRNGAHGVGNHLKRSILDKQRDFAQTNVGRRHVGHRASMMLKKLANIVVKSLCTINIWLGVSVPAPVLNKHALKENGQQVFVPIVGRLLNTISARSANIAPENANTMPSVSVIQVEKLKDRRPVYNLEVEDTHEYFANGVLVHNCLDSIRYAVAWLTEPREQVAVVDKTRPIGPRW